MKQLRTNSKNPLFARKGTVVSTIKSWIDYWNRRVKQLTIWDLKLAQISTAAWMLLLAKVFPQIMELSIWWFVLVIALCAPWVIYVFWLKKSK